MPKTTDSVIFSETQKAILETALQNPAMSNAEVAEKTGARLTLVRDTRAQYEDDIELADATKKREAESEASDEQLSTAHVDDLSETQQAIVDVAADDPTLTNAEIAVETGARISLVRDTRDHHRELIDAASETTAPSEPDPNTETELNTETEPTGTPTLSDTEQAIIELATEDPTLTNGEIADRTGARLTLVRDTRAQHDASEERSTADDQPETTATIEPETTAVAEPETTAMIDDAEAFSQTQIEIIETALGNPELPNSDIAAETGTRVPLVRDTISAYESAAHESASSESDDSAESTESVSKTASKTESNESAADIDADSVSETQLEILETALAHPELTNGEIADRTGTRITLVRDTIFEHTYDETPWASGSGKESAEEPNGEHDVSVESGDDSVDVAEPDDKEVDIPETTAADVFSAAQRSILETTLQNPELTNAEIATQTGTRLTLVRDTRATYADGVALAEDNDIAENTSAENTSAESESKSDSQVSLSDTQRAILKAASNNPKQTNAEIAESTGARLALVRDTREQYQDDVHPEDETDTTRSTGDAKPDTTDSTDNAKPDTTDSSEDSEVESTTDTTAGSAKETDNNESNVGLLIGIVLVFLVAFSLAVAVGAI